MSSTRPSLRQHLLNKINEYQTIDNPVPAPATTWTGKAKALAVTTFSSHGASGRARAEEYKREIPEYIDNEDRFSRKVLEDIKGDKLGTSKALRLRLLEALANFYEISEENIRSRSTYLNQVDRSAAAAGATGAAGFAMVMRSPDELRRDAIFDLVKSANNEKLREKAPQERRDARQFRMTGGDDSL